MSPQIVIIESPFAGPTKAARARNLRYAQACLLDSLKRGEAPYASHLLYTQVLDDLVANERRQGMEAGFAFYRVASLSAVYTDLGISGGMRSGMERARAHGVTYELRAIPGWAA